MRFKPAQGEPIKQGTAGSGEPGEAGGTGPIVRGTFSIDLSTGQAQLTIPEGQPVPLELLAHALERLTAEMWMLLGGAREIQRLEQGKRND